MHLQRPLVFKSLSCNFEVVVQSPFLPPFIVCCLVFWDKHFLKDKRRDIQLFSGFSVSEQRIQSRVSVSFLEMTERSSLETGNVFFFPEKERERES